MDNKLKIIFFADAAAEHTVRWVKFFADEGHEVYIITWNDLSTGGAVYREDDIKTSFHPATLCILGGKRPDSKIHYFLWLISLVFSVRNLVNKIQPDLIHSHSVGAYAWITLLLPKARTVLTPWGTDVLIDMKSSLVNRLLTKKSLNRSTVVTVDAEHIKNELICEGIDQNKIKTIYFGTDTEFYVRSNAEREAIRAKYDIAAEDLIVISTRTLNPIHDVFATLKAIPIVLAQNRNVKFFIASDGVERSEMEEYVLKNGLSKNVIFPGYLTMEQMVAFLSASDIYVSSSRADAGLAGSTAEAMSTGLPVVVSNNSDNSFWVKDAGILFADGDVNGIAEGILSLAGDSSLRVKLGINGRAKILAENDYKTQMNKVNDLYLSICAENE